MRIFISRSKDCRELADRYIEYIVSKGYEICLDEPGMLNKSDGVLICVSGKDNADAKAELNMALERKLPVAYIVETNGYVDAGFKFQLGLAAEIEADDFEELAIWLGTVSDLAQHKSKESRKRKMIIVAAAIVVAAIVLVMIILVSKNSEKQKTTATLDNAITGEIVRLSDNEVAESLAVEMSRKYLGDDPASVKVLDISEEGLEDISFLADAVNLEELDISNNDIKDINVLVTLKELKKLDISGNPIEDDTILDYMDGIEIRR